MKTLIKLASLGALVAVAVEFYRRRQPYESRGLGASNDMVADTNSVVTGDAGQAQSDPQPQDWRGAQNVLGV
jgi:hypothetical protein